MLRGRARSPCRQAYQRRATPKVLLTRIHPVSDAGAVKHRMALAGALAIGVMIAFLMVGRARAEALPGDGWTAGPSRAVAIQALW